MSVLWVGVSSWAWSPLPALLGPYAWQWLGLARSLQPDWWQPKAIQTEAHSRWLWSCRCFYSYRYKKCNMSGLCPMLQGRFTEKASSCTCLMLGLRFIQVSAIAIASLLVCEMECLHYGSTQQGHPNGRSLSDLILYKINQIEGTNYVSFGFCSINHISRYRINPS